MTDRELVQGIIDRNEAAFKELVENHQQLVIRTCYGLVNELEDARDLAQEVFIEVMRSAASFRGSAKLSSWVYRIAVNKSLNHLKKRRRWTMVPFFSSSEKREDVAEEAPGGNSSFGGDTLMEERELKKALHLAISRLPENQKIAFTLHKYEELPYKEIAEVMDLSLSSVESLIHRARLNLQKTLNHYYESNLK